MSSFSFASPLQQRTLTSAPLHFQTSLQWMLPLLAPEPAPPVSGPMSGESCTGTLRPADTTPAWPPALPWPCRVSPETLPRSRRLVLSAAPPEPFRGRAVPSHAGTRSSSGTGLAPFKPAAHSTAFRTTICIMCTAALSAAAFGTPAIGLPRCARLAVARVPLVVVIAIAFAFLEASGVPLSGR